MTFMWPRNCEARKFEKYLLGMGRVIGVGVKIAFCFLNKSCRRI